MAVAMVVFFAMAFVVAIVAVPMVAVVSVSMGFRFMDFRPMGFVRAIVASMRVMSVIFVRAIVTPTVVRFRFRVLLMVLFAAFFSGMFFVAFLPAFLACMFFVAHFPALLIALMGAVCHFVTMVLMMS